MYIHLTSHTHICICVSVISGAVVMLHTNRNMAETESRIWKQQPYMLRTRWLMIVRRAINY